MTAEETEQCELNTEITKMLHHLLQLSQIILMRTDHLVRVLMTKETSKCRASWRCMTLTNVIRRGVQEESYYVLG